MATALIKSWWRPSAKTAKAIDVHEKIGALDAAKFHYDTSMRDLRERFETEANRLHSEYLDKVLEVHGSLDVE